MFCRKRKQSDFKAEIAAHIELETVRLKEQGLSEEEARVAARRAFGNVTQAEERFYESGRWLGWDHLAQDVRFALRMLRKNPGFTLVAVLTLALGIGANTAIFSVIDAVMLRKLPVKDPQDLIQLATVGPYGVATFSHPGYRRFRDENHVCSEMGVIGWLNKLHASIDGQAETVEGRIVSGNFFSLLGVGTSVGRTFTSQDEKTPQSSAVAVISYDYWKRRFGLSPSVVGKGITLNRTVFAIVGVTPAGFSGPEVGYSPDVYVPMTTEPVFHEERSWLDQPDFHWLRIVGRLKPTVSREQARADLDVIYREVLADIPTQGWSPTERRDFLSMRLEVASAASGLVFGLPKELPKTLSILMAMVGLVLLVSCANVANLLLGRATARQKEIAVRLAIGAGRYRLIRQLLTEGAVLAVAAGALGLLCAYWASAAVVTLLSLGRESLYLDLRPDPHVLGFTGALALLATLLFGVAPALHGTRLDLTPTLKESAGGLRSQRPRLGLAKGLVVSQVALSLLLLFGAGLFVRTLENLENLDAGFERKGVVLFDIDPTKSGNKGPAATRLYKQLLEHISAIRSVRSASLSDMTPITGGGGWDNAVWVEGYTPAPDESTTVYLNAVGPRYFDTLHTPLLLGREFNARDTETTPKVGIINQTMARYFFGSHNPVGRRFGWYGEDRNKVQFEIVGVAKDAKYETLREQVPRTAYLDCFQMTMGAMTVEVRTAANPAAVISPIRNELKAVDASLQVGGFTTLEERVDESLGHERLMATLSSLFGGLAVLLACVGLYGVVAYSVSRRTREIGIRMALGAGRAQIFGMILGESAALIAAGVAVGLPVAIAAARLISGQLYGLKFADPASLAGAILLLTVLAAIAGYVPARRATKVDPMLALRCE